MTLTPRQLRIAALNTLQKPRNHAPVILQAIQNNNPAEAGSLNPVAVHHMSRAIRKSASAIVRRFIKCLVVDVYCHGWISHRTVMYVFSWLGLKGL